MFRDKWINKPLPQERMRPLLNDISVTTRDQLTAFRDLGNIATRLEDLIRATTPPQEPEKRRYDRRATASAVQTSDRCRCEGCEVQVRRCIGAVLQCQVLECGCTA